MPQLGYSFPDAALRAGMPGSSRAAELARVDSFVNPELFDEDTVTVGGSVDSDLPVSFTVLGEVVATAGGHQTASDTVDDIADALVAAGQAVVALQSRVTFFKSTTNVVGVRAKVPDVDLGTVETAEPGSITLTVAQVVNGAANVLIPSGVGVVLGTAANLIALPTTASNMSDFLGVTRLNDAGIDENTGLQADEDGYSSGATVGVQRDEEIAVHVTTAVTAGSHPHWILSGANAGKFRGTLQGTAQVITVTPTAEDDIPTVMQVHLSNGQTFGLAFNTGTSATATTISNQIRAAIAANAELAKHIAGTGTSTAILTSISGVTFDVNFEEAGVILAFAKAYTTAGVVQSHMLTKYKFSTSTSGPGLAKINLG